MAKKIFGVNKNIFLLGIVSLLTDISSEMIFSVFSIFFTVILGAAASLLGIVEGFSDFASSSLDYISGYLSDKTGKRKAFAVFGYGFSTISKFLLVIPNSVFLASSFRVVERFGKSFRGPPRDAWISSLAAKSRRGYSFGLHKALDKSGAVLGPIIAYFLLAHYGQNIFSFSLLFKIAIIPAFIAVLLLIFIKEPHVEPQKKENIFKTYHKLGKRYRHYLKSSIIFSIAYFSFGFLLLKAYNTGFQIKDIVLLYALFNISFVIFAAPIGILGDYVGRKKIIALEYILYFIMSIGFIFASKKSDVIVLFILFGVFYAIDESQGKAYISDLEKYRRGTAIGLYNFSTGAVYLPASIIAGYLWTINDSYTFIFAAIISILALLFFLNQKP